MSETHTLVTVRHDRLDNASMRLAVFTVPFMPYDLQPVEDRLLPERRDEKPVSLIVNTAAPTALLSYGDSIQISVPEHHAVVVTAVSNVEQAKTGIIAQLRGEPVEVVQYTSAATVPRWVELETMLSRIRVTGLGLTVDTPQGERIAHFGDWIVRRCTGDLYVIPGAVCYLQPLSDLPAPQVGVLMVRSDHQLF